MNIEAEPAAPMVRAPRPKEPKPKRAKDIAFEMFERNAAIEEVAAATERAPSTIRTYLAEFISDHPTHSVDPWIAPEIFKSVADAAAEVGTQYQKPIFDKLNGTVSYEEIRLVLARLNH
jgi:ATP-dependent DNA helicase RecQ